MRIFLLYFSSCGCRGNGTEAKRRWSFWRSKETTNWVEISSGWLRAWQRRSRTDSPSARWPDCITVGSVSREQGWEKCCAYVHVQDFCFASWKQQDALCFMGWDHLKPSSQNMSDVVKPKNISGPDSTNRILILSLMCTYTGRKSLW